MLGIRHPRKKERKNSQRDINEVHATHLVQRLTRQYTGLQLSTAQNVGLSPLGFFSPFF